MKSRKNRRHIVSITLIIPGVLLVFASLTSCRSGQSSQATPDERDIFISDLKERTFNYFWEQVDKPTWGIPDRYPTRRFTSIAATGFGLTAYLVGIKNGYISRDEGAERVLNTLRWFWNSRQGPETHGVTGYKGFYYHFLTYDSGIRFENTELSTIDTGLLMAGILACQSYFDMNNPDETEIRTLADSLFLRVEWDWAMNGQDAISMGYHPGKGFLKAKWTGYNEAMVLLIMAMGSPTHPINANSWKVWCAPYVWNDFYGYDMVNFSPLFGHQYSHMFIDFRGIQDDYMRSKDIDYFENSRRATLANRAYCADNPGSFEAYSDSVWGLTACDGPGQQRQLTSDGPKQFWAYRARGASAIGIIDDGTIAPTAAGGSIPFLPEECIHTLMNMKEVFGDSLYGQYGFRDAFNMTFKTKDGNRGWFDIDYLGIDQGPILIQLENYQTGLIWDLMKKNKYIVQGLRRAGFTGGWLENVNNE